ncbi:MAG: hypothetical protein ACNS62_24065 [Candidatus Cyclobacteriaceae bacterium M3_2C_046]
MLKLNSSGDITTSRLIALFEQIKNLNHKYKTSRVLINAEAQSSLPDLIELSDLTPYIPSDIKIAFKINPQASINNQIMFLKMIAPQENIEIFYNSHAAEKWLETND